MKMIIGGAYQGKLSYAQNAYPGLSFLDAGEAMEAELLKSKGIYHLEAFIRKEIASGRELEGFVQRLIEAQPEAVILCDEVGYGVVPMDAVDRSAREATGRICTSLAAYSESVVRVVCGIGKELKG